MVLPFNVACGFCDNCRAGKSAFCLTVNDPGTAGGAYGYVGMGPYSGGQAEYLRVPFADYNCVQLPQGDEHEKDFAMLADIFPTGYHATELAGVKPGETVAVYGAGPVGLMAAYSAQLKGASRIFVVDHVQNRLDLAKELGAEPINFDDGDPAEQIVDKIEGYGVDRGIDAVGYQLLRAPEEQPAVVLNQLVDTVRHTGGLGVVGLYLPSDQEHPMNTLPKASYYSGSDGSLKRSPWVLDRQTPNSTPINSATQLLQAGQAASSSQELPCGCPRHTKIR